jgi:hypothetical protein
MQLTRRRRLEAFACMGTALVLATWFWLRTGHARQSVPEHRAGSTVAGAGPSVVEPQTVSNAQPALLERGLHAVADAEGKLSRERWDPAYVVRQLGNNPDTILQWVQRNTYWVPYRGVLRGPQGVLMDHQGNDLDRALLLSALLRIAGHTTRLAHGELSGELAADLLPRLIARRHRPEPPSRPSAPHDVAELQIAMAREGIVQPGLADRIQSKGERMLRVMDSLRSRTADQSARLLSLIRPPSDGLEWTVRRDSALTVLHDHWWVQIQRPSGWGDLDPDAALGVDFARVTPEETVAPDALDSSLYHRVSVRLVIERWDGEAFRQRRALAYTVVGPESWDQSLELRIMPNEWPSDMESQGTDVGAAIRAAALAQQSWHATLLARGDVAADVLLRATGETGSATAGGPLGGLGRGIAGALGASQNAGILTGAWLEYEIQVPEQAAETMRRPIFDLIGADARAGRVTEKPVIDETKKLQRSLALIRSTEILPLSSALAPEFVLHLGGQGLLRNSDLLRASAEGALRDSTPASVRGPQPLPSQLYALALARFESKDTADVYLDRPNILTRHTFIALTSRGPRVREATDIVANDVAVELGERDGFSARLRQGVRDTNAEAVLPDAKSFGAVALAFTAGSKWVVADSANAGKLSGLRDEDRHYLAADLHDGYIVVAPTTRDGAGHQEFAGWWRIDPRNGHTLGMAPTGWGQSLVERVAIAIVFTWEFEYLICMGTFVYNHEHQEALAPPFPLNLTTPLAAESEKRECSINAAISGFIVAGVEIFAVTWPLVIRTIAGRGYSGVLTGQPMFASGEPEPGDLPPVFGKGSSSPKPDCPPGGTAAASSEPPAVAPEPPAAEPPAGGAQGEEAPQGEAVGTPEAPAERDWPYWNDGTKPPGLRKPGAYGPNPVNPDRADQVARGLVADENAAEAAMDEAAETTRRAKAEYEGFVREWDRADANYKEVQAKNPNSDEANQAYENYLDKGRAAATKRTEVDALEAKSNAAAYEFKKARYRAYWANRVAQANRKAYEAEKEADEASKAWDGVDHDSPNYARWRDAVERFRQAGRELYAATMGESSVAEATDQTFLAPGEPAAHNPPAVQAPSGGASSPACAAAPASPAAASVGGAPPAGAPSAASPAAQSVGGASASAGGLPVSPAAQSVAGAAAVGVGVGGAP